MNEKNIPRIREAGSVQVLLPYLGSHNGLFQSASIVALARLVNEKEAENLMTHHVNIFSLLIRRLKKAWRRQDHRESWGYSVAELTQTLRQLARNDANKKVLVDQGCLPLLVKILGSQNKYEVAESLEALWVLTFDEDNKQKMVDEPDLVKRVWGKYSHDSSNDKIKKSSYGILWSLLQQLKMEELEFVDIATKIEIEKSQADMKPTQQSLQQAQTKTPDGVSFAGHVMLSYDWGHQKTILQICKELKAAGVPVWIDVDFMEGSTLETMAKAVEKCCIFIMAVSKAYKESPNTRLEAGYAQNLKKPIIPLMMETGYKPDGWLGIIMESKMYYEFNGKDTFNAKMPKLLEEIKNTIGQEIIGDTKEKPDSSSLVAQSGQQGDTRTLTEAQLQTLIDRKIQEQQTEKKGGNTMTVICNVL